MLEITCPNCQRVSPPDHTFCTGCGTRLSAGPIPEDEVPAAQTPADGEAQQAFRHELASVRTQLQDTALLIEQLQDRISRLEGSQPATTQPQQPSPTAPSLAAPMAHASDQEPRPEPVQASTPGPDATLSDPSPDATGAGASGEGVVHPRGGGDSITSGLPPLGFSIDWEQVLGRNWFAIIGAVALVLGIGFFLKLAFDNNWIGDTGRVALGIVAGLVLLGAGEYTSRRVPIWSQPVTAGGAAILYLSIYAAFGLYQLVPPEVAFLFLALVIALAGVLALRYGSIVIAILGVIGAFLAPVLLGPSLPDVRFVLLYILVVDLGILGVSTFRNWRWFTLLGWVGTYGLFAYWLEQYPDYGPVLVQLALTAVFLVFTGATTLFHLIWRRVPNPFDMTLVVLNATAFFGLTVAVLWEDYEIWFGLITVGLALFYGLIAFVSLKRSNAPPQLTLIALPVALVFLTVAVPLQLSGLWVAMAWAAQGTVLVWVGFLLGRWQMRVFGLGVIALAVAHLFLFDAWVDLGDFQPVLNDRFPVYVMVIAAFYAAGILYWRNRDLAYDRERHIATPSLFGIANLLTLTLFSMEIDGYFQSRQMFGNRLAQESWQFMENAKHLSITALLAVYASILTAVGLARNLTLARWAGLGLIGLAALKLLAIDTLLVRLDPLTFIAFLNLHFLTFLMMVVVLLGLAWWTWRARAWLPGWEEHTFRGLIIAANVIGVWALSQESIHYFDSREVRMAADYFSAKHLSLTVLWAVYAIGVIGVGIAQRSSRIRLAGMALLAVPVVKLFVFDVFLLERGYRVAAFVTLGALLLGTGLIYQRYSQAIRGFLFGQRA